MPKVRAFRRRRLRFIVACVVREERQRRYKRLLAVFTLLLDEYFEVRTGVSAVEAFTALDEAAWFIGQLP